MKTAITASLLLVFMLLAGSVYSNDSLEFKAKLTGDQEVPPVETPARGEAKLEVNEDQTKIEYELRAKSPKENEDRIGLLGAAGAHIHCAPVGVNGPIAAFLSGVITGGVDGKVKIKATLTDANIVENTCSETITSQQNIKSL